MTIDEIVKIRWTFGENVFSDNLTRTFRGVLDEIELRLHQLVAEILFEFNDAKTRATVYNATKCIMDEFVQAGKVNDFRIVCDEGNNTEENVANNEFNLDVYLKFYSSQPWMQVNLHASKNPS